MRNIARIFIKIIMGVMFDSGSPKTVGAFISRDNHNLPDASKLFKALLRNISSNTFIFKFSQNKKLCHIKINFWATTFFINNHKTDDFLVIEN